MQEERALPEIIDTLRYRWPLVVLGSVFVMIGAAVYVESLPSQYTAEAIVSFSPRSDVPSATADTVRLLMPKYVAYVTAPATIEEVAPSTGVPAPEIEEALDATAASETGNLLISVELEDPEEAAGVANAFAEQAVEFSNTDELVAGDLIAPALVPESPSGPPRRLFELAALIAGAALSVAIAFVLERGRPRLRSWRQISRAAGYPVLGRLPRLRTLRHEPLEGFKDPRVGAAVRTLRTNLARHLDGRDVDAVMVTSSAPGDGKTTVAALYAESLARVGTRVLLVDADLRRPALANFANLKPKRKGFAAVLAGKARLSSEVRPGWADNLHLLPTDVEPEAGDLLAIHIEEFIRKARDEYDLLVLDTPPVLGTDDTRVLAHHASTVLLVVPVGSPAQPVNEAVLALEAVRADIAGIVCNREGHTSAPYEYI